MIDALAAVNAVASTQFAQGPTASSQAEKAGAPAMSFTEALKNTATQQVNTVQHSEQMTMQAMHGKASLQDVVQATVQAELAVEGALAIRNKLIEGYQEIMRMPV
jgi:flagellar hook-basal body complex protein FliE